MTTINVNGETFAAQGRWMDISQGFRCPYCGARARLTESLTQIGITLDDGSPPCQLVLVYSFECQTKFIVPSGEYIWYTARSEVCKMIATPETDDII